jgi:hypothetical protein
VAQNTTAGKASKKRKKEKLTTDFTDGTDEEIPPFLISVIREIRGQSSSFFVV